MARFQNCVMLIKMAGRYPDIMGQGDIKVPGSRRTKSKETPFLDRPEPISNTVYNTLEYMAIIVPESGAYIETNCYFLLVTTCIGVQTTNPNRNIAGRTESKSPFQWQFSLKKLTLILPFTRIK